jgi:hypothetical protein
MLPANTAICWHNHDFGNPRILPADTMEYAVKRLESALKAFGPGFHVYQYLFKSNRPDIPFASYDDPVVEAAIDQRRQFFEAKRDHLYQVEIFYANHSNAVW